MGFSEKAGPLGQRHIDHFMRGNGQPFVHAPATQLSEMVKRCNTFQKLSFSVRASIEIQARTQARAGSINPESFVIRDREPEIPQRLEFNERNDGAVLATIIHGIQGLVVTMKNFTTRTGERGALTYSATLRYDLCDTFGFGLEDLRENEPATSTDSVTQGLRAAWVLQHDNMDHRRDLFTRGTHRPYIVEIKVDLPISGILVAAA